MAIIDTSQPRIPLWIVIGLGKTGNLIINAICLEQSRANKYRKILQEQIDDDFGSLIKVWIEKSEANHLYQWEMIGMPKND